MIQQTKRKYFEIWGDTQSQNIFLKGLLVLTIIINISLLVTVINLASKKPLLISKEINGHSLLANTKPVSKEFIKSELVNSITRFAKLRHNWNYKNINKQLTKSSVFVAQSFKEQFIKANKPQVKTAKKKKISQRFYLSSKVKISLETKEALITGDRILIVEGLRATQPMSFKISYQFGERTTANPEGVYIRSESLVSSLSH